MEEESPTTRTTPKRSQDALLVGVLPILGLRTIRPLISNLRGLPAVLEYVRDADNNAGLLLDLTIANISYLAAQDCIRNFAPLHAGSIATNGGVWRHY